MIIGFSRTRTYHVHAGGRRGGKTAGMRKFLHERITGVTVSWSRRRRRGNYSATLRWHRFRLLGPSSHTWPNATQIGGLWITQRTFSLGWISFELVSRWFLRDQHPKTRITA